MNNYNQNGFSLKRELGLFTGTMLVAGLVIGSGVFKKIIPMAQANISGTAILLAWVIAGLITLLGALSVGGLSSLTDKSGGTYEYFRISFGKLFAFISGWSDFMIVGTGVNAALAFFFAQTINAIVTIPDPLESLAHISIGNYIFPFESSGIKFVAILTIIVLTIINSIGTKESGIFNNIVTSIKILGVALIIIVGLSKPTPINNLASETSIITEQGFSFLGNFLTAMLAAFWAYDGWIYVTNITGEVINPKRNMPLILIFGIFIAIIVFIAMNFVYLRLVPIESLKLVTDNEVGAIFIAQSLFGDIGKTILTVVILFCVFGALNSNLVSLPRKYYQMAIEGYFFSNAKKINPKFRTPIIALIYSMIWSSLLVVSNTFDTLTNMVVFTAFIFYGALCLALIKMKRNKTITVKVPGYPYAPILFLAFSTIFLTNTLITEPKDSLFGLFLIISSMPFYFYFRLSNGGISLKSRKIT